MTICNCDPVDEAIAESFPASDPPSWAASKPSCLHRPVAGQTIGRGATSAPMLRVAEGIEDWGFLDPPGRALDVLTNGLEGEVESALRGRWLGHALHPLLTDLPLGLWLGAGVLDVLGGQHARPSARLLVGMGLLAALPTMASGLAEWKTLSEPSSRRVAVVHGLGNLAVTGCYFQSWRRRRRESPGAGVKWGMLGGALAWATGYLGGHLSLGLGVGTGKRRAVRS